MDQTSLQNEALRLDSEIGKIFTIARNHNLRITDYPDECNKIMKYLAALRDIDNALGRYNVPRLDTIPDFAATRAAIELEKTLKYNQYNVSPNNYQMSSVGYSGIPQQQTAFNYGSFVNNNNNTTGITVFGETRTQTHDRLAEKNKIIDPIKPYDVVKETTPTEPVVLKPFEGNEYPLLLSEGLTAIRDESIPGYLSTKVHGDDIGRGRIHDVSMSPKVLETDNRVLTNSVFWHALKDGPESILTTTEVSKLFAIPAEFVDMDEYTVMVKTLNELPPITHNNTIGNVLERLEKVISIISAFYAPFYKLVDKYASKRFRELELFSTVRGNSIKLTGEFSIGDTGIDIINSVFFNTTKKSAKLILQNKKSVIRIIKYMTSLVTNSCASIAGEGSDAELVITIKDKFTSLIITDSNMAVDIQSIKSDEAYMVRSDSHPAIYELLTNSFLLSSSESDNIGRLRVITLTQNQEETYAYVYNDMNGNYVITK